jgi:hypothetical protein
VRANRPHRSSRALAPAEFMQFHNAEMSRVQAHLSMATGRSITGLSAAVIAAYIALYLALYWVSYIHPMRGLNITPWNPQSALAVALLVWKPRAWWLVLLANVWAIFSPTARYRRGAS